MAIDAQSISLFKLNNQNEIIKKFYMGTNN